jgi:hypothetical protein
MSGRHEAELAAEFAPGGFWQAFDMRLAIMPFGAFVGDQQMSAGLKAIFERLSPDDPYRVGLDCAPIRQAATGNIGWRDFNDRWRRGAKARTTAADVNHSPS